MSAGQLDFDAVIVGGGPVGLTMALALAESLPGIQLALVDRRPPDPSRDRRASAISAGGRRLLGALGVWEQVVGAAEPVRAMEVTDSGADDIARPRFLRFSGPLADGEPFAHMVPNTTLLTALLEALAGRVETVVPAGVAGFAAGPGRAVATLEDGRALTAPLVIAADGAQSGLRKMAGIATSGTDYRQSGLVTTIGHALPHNGVAFEHFRPAGPFASLPLPGNRSSLVWTETPAEAARLAALPPAELALAIEAAMGSSLGTVTLEGPVQVFPLHLQIAGSFIAARLALIGDAAHVIHPVAGQGLNLGLKDVAALAEVAVEAFRLGADPGASDVLARYERWRRADTMLMAGATDGLNRLFSNDIGPLRALRDFGLSLVERLPPVKGGLIAAASGLSRGGPRLFDGLPI